MTHADYENLGDGNALDAYQSAAMETAIYPGQGTPMGLLYVSLKLNGEAGELAEHVGKAMRDDALFGSRRILVGQRMAGGEPVTAVFCNSLTPERRNAIIREAGDVLWYIAAVCREMGVRLSDVAATNIDKLNSRKKRGSLRGSGDNR